MWTRNLSSLLSYHPKKLINALRRFHSNRASEKNTFTNVHRPLKYIVTGPPGSGKTTLILALEIVHGVGVVREAATDIIMMGLAQGNDKPWQAPDFDSRILALQIERLANARMSSKKIVLCDRSPIDIYAYSEFHKTPLPPNIDTHIEHMVKDPTLSKTVFFIENLGYVRRTAIRPETFKEACALESLLHKYYTRFGFEIIRVPDLPIIERTDYVRSHLHDSEQKNIVSDDKILVDITGSRS